MKSDNAKVNPSIWMETTPVEERRSLRVNKECDVCIVGGGITGITLAYTLSRAGQSVIVIDDGNVGCGDTVKTTAHICVEFDRRFHELEEIHGTENATLACKSQLLAINTITEIIEREKIDCEFRRVPGYLLLGREDELETMKKELDTCHRLGLESVELLMDGPPISLNLTRPALHFPDQGRFNVLKYLNSLVQCVERQGGRIYGNTHATSFRDGPEAVIETNSNHTIKAKNLVIATHTPVSDLMALHTKQFPYRSYVITADITGDGALPDCLIWDTEDPYHYVRMEPSVNGNGNMLIVGGEDHRTGQETDFEERYDRLEAWAKEMIPNVGPRHNSWSGQVYETVDGLPYIGRDPEHRSNVFVATGFAGCGMTMGTLSALLISDLILEHENVFAELYEPRRKSLKVLGTYLQENLNSAKQYAQLVGPQRDLAEAVKELPNGEGEVIHTDGQTLAICKDENGRVLSCAAICPHLKAVVSWNSLEKSWDCPAHGSRFDREGKVLNGPANADLEVVELPLNEEPDECGIGTLGLVPQPEV